MPNLYASKRPHGLHLCQNAEDFRAAFEAALGQSIGAFLSELTSGAKWRAVTLAGSIPEGIASEVSDIDLMVVLDTEVPPSLAQSDTVSAKATPGGVELGVIDGVFAGMEIDVAFISLSRLVALCAALARGGVTLREEDIRVLDRIKRGWVLDDDDCLDRLPAVTASRNLEIYCTTNYYSIALKRLEDAVAAEERDPILSRHLARLCVEQAFYAYLASRGHCYLSAKWPALIQHRMGGSPVGDGLDLLFPGATELRGYLRDVQRLARTIRDLIEQDTAFRIAFDFCPQIYQPDCESVS